MKFHHIGIACNNIEEEVKKLRGLNYTKISDIFTDNIQGVRGLFLEGEGPRLELLAPTSSLGVLTPWLKSGSKMYHMAYTTDINLSKEIENLQKEGAKIVVKPTPASAFNQQMISFLMLPNMLLIELIGNDAAD
jgi:methylmalonyl-CoA/ethylmalonyl-CoA epimerase